MWLCDEQVTDVVMESTGSYWIPVFNLLEGHVTVVLANPEEVKNRKGHKTDRKDAEHLADLLRHIMSDPVTRRRRKSPNWRAEQQTQGAATDRGSRGQPHERSR